MAIYINVSRIFASVFCLDSASRHVEIFFSLSRNEAYISGKIRVLLLYIYIYISWIVIDRSPREARSFRFLYIEKERGQVVNSTNLSNSKRL